MANKVVIIGGGLSGLVAANALRQHGVSPLIIDKGRSAGGRLATRQMGRATLDHGAQFFTVRSPEFRSAVDEWIAAGVVGEWCQGFSEVDGYPRYRVEGGMRFLARHLAQDLDVVAGVRAQSLIRSEDGWAVAHDGGVREPDHAAAVLLATPVPEALALLAAGGVSLDDSSTGLADIRYHRVIALLVTGPGLCIEEPGARQLPDDEVFTFISDNQAKGISPEPAVTFHTAHKLSADLWDQPREAILQRLLPEAASALGVEQDAFAEVQTKKWRYAGPVVPWPERCQVVASDPGPVIVCGDAFGGPKVEGAYLSGAAAATTLIETLGVDPDAG